MFAVGGADGNKIGRIAAIIPILQSGGGDAVFILKFICHWFLLVGAVGFVVVVVVETLHARSLHKHFL